jgi:hypothetical protein
VKSTNYEGLHNLYIFQILLGWSIKEDEMDIACSTHGEMRNSYKILVGEIEVKISLGRPRRRWEDILECFLEKWVRKIRTGLIYLRTGTSGGLLWTRWWTFGFHKKARNLLTTRVAIAFSRTHLHGVSELEHKLLNYLLCNCVLRYFIFLGSKYPPQLFILKILPMCSRSFRARDQLSQLYKFM